jgi:hypothetical protein
MKTKIFLMAAAAVMISFSSCKKEAGLIDQNSIDLADDDAVADAVFDDVFNTADNASIIVDNLAKSAEAKSAGTVLSDTCPAITVTRPTGAQWPKLVTVDYGTGCTGFNDNTRKGKILIEVTGPRLQAGSKKTVTFDNYYFNDMKVEGTKVLENEGYNSNQNLVISVRLTGGKITLPDGKTIERSIDHQREWTAGLLTKSIWDDECLITGTASGKNIKDVQYTNTITTPIQWKRACRFFTAGIIKMERTGAPTIEINYGTGECDAKATVTRGTESKEIILRSRFRTMR